MNGNENLLDSSPNLFEHPFYGLRKRANVLIPIIHCNEFLIITRVMRFVSLSVAISRAFIAYFLHFLRLIFVIFTLFDCAPFLLRQLNCCVVASHWKTIHSVSLLLLVSFIFFLLPVLLSFPRTKNSQQNELDIITCLMACDYLYDRSKWKSDLHWVSHSVSYIHTAAIAVTVRRCYVKYVLNV